MFGVLVGLGVAIIGERLLVADTGNRRVLIWHELPVRHGQPADEVLGQADFASRDENAGTGVNAVGMRWPHGLAAIEGGFCVADAGNNRIMVWREWPQANGAPCDFVLGQPGFNSCEHNGGAYSPNAGVVNMPYGLATSGARLLAADTANSRLIGWRIDELQEGTAAGFLTGQPDFAAKGDNRWQAPCRDSLCWPYGIATWGDLAAVADSGNNRVLLWRVAP